MTTLKSNNNSDSRVMFEKIKHIPRSDKVVVTGFISHIIQLRPILIICNLAALYYYEKEEFNRVGNKMQMNPNKTRLDCVKSGLLSAYGTMVIDGNANYTAIWHLKLLSLRQRTVGVWIGIVSKQILNNHLFIFPAFYNYQENIFYASNMKGKKKKRENRYNAVAIEGDAWKGFKSGKIIKVILNARKKQLRIVCENASTCFNEIKIENDSFTLGVCGLFLKGDSLEIMKFEKKY